MLLRIAAKKGAQVLRNRVSRISIGCAFLLAALLCSCVSKDTQKSGLDCWENGLLHGHSFSGFRGAPGPEISNLYRTSADFPSFLKRSCFAFAHRYRDAQGYRALAEALIEQRDEVLKKPKRMAAAQANQLLMISDSVLYALHVFFPKALETFTMVNQQVHSSCPTSYFGVPICNGDIMISKSSAFSSALFQLRSPYQYAYSHADILVHGKNPKEILALTADPGTTGLEDPLFPEMPGRLAVYRVKAGAAAAIARFISFKRGKPFVREKLLFNYSLRPGCGDDRYFCTQLVYCAYEKAPVNPYPKTLWTETDTSRSRFIRSLNPSMDFESIPAPGDLEFNSALKRVVYLVQLKQLLGLRIQYVATKLFLKWMRKEPKLKSRYLLALDRWAKKGASADAKTLNPLKRRFSFLDDATGLQDRKLPGVSARQVYFYADFQLQILPALKAALSRKLSTRPLTLSELRIRIAPLLRRELQEFIDFAP